jgi:starch synthase
MTGKIGLRSVMLAAEAVPYAKAGGLGDVIGALPTALELLGVNLSVAIPASRKIIPGF